MTRTAAILSVSLLGVAAAPPARAQSADDGRAGRFELSVGPIWNGRESFGSRDATETTGAGATFTLFTASSELASAPGVEARLGIRVNPRLEVETRGAYSRPVLNSQVTFDAEISNAPIVASDTIQQFVIGGDALWYVRAPQPRDRVRIFASGGAGYLRQLENGGTLIVTGLSVDAGGGVKLLLRSRDAGWWRGVGVRADARAEVRTRGVALDGRAHASPSLGASLFLRF